MTMITNSTTTNVTHHTRRSRNPTTRRAILGLYAIRPIVMKVWVRALAV